MPRWHPVWLVFAALCGTATAQDTSGFRPLPRKDDDPGQVRVRSSFRSTARSNARGTEPFEKAPADKAAAVLSPSLARSADRTLLRPQYLAEFVGGKQRPIADYRDDGDSFWIQWVEGGHARYLKPMVQRFDSLDESQSAQILAELQAAPRPASGRAGFAALPRTQPPAPSRTAHSQAPRPYDNGPLTLADFAASPPADRGRMLAYTYSAINYHYRYQTRVTPLGVQLVATSITAVANVLPDKSWNTAPADIRLLDHEQGHFDITQLHTVHWRRHAGSLIAQTSLAAQATTSEAAQQNLQARVQNEFQSIYQAWEAEQVRYDNETAHGVNRLRQTQWRERLDSELAGKRPAAR